MIAITKSPTKDKIDKYILALIIVQYIEDITWLHKISLWVVLKNISCVSAANAWNIFFNTRREISYLQAAM